MHPERDGAEISDDDAGRLGVRIPRAVLAACALAPVISILPGLLRLHASILDPLPSEAVSMAIIPRYIVEGLLPLLMFATFFFAMTARLRPMLRLMLRAVAATIFVNALTILNKPASRWSARSLARSSFHACYGRDRGGESPRSQSSKTHLLVPHVARSWPCWWGWACGCCSPRHCG
jgi:hypothetical protein